MTDNRTTELLHKLLDERGVEYEAYMDINNRCVTKWRTYHGAFVFFAVEREGKLFVETTSDTEHSAICTPEQAISATLKSGTLTAEHVRKAAHGHYKLRMVRDVDGFDVPQVMFDWQAIADELNAELGSRTCLDVGGDGDYFICSECSSRLDVTPYYCPNCGAKVVK